MERAGRAAAPDQGWAGPFLVLPALALLAGLFFYPLALSVGDAFRVSGGAGLGNFEKAIALYGLDIGFTLVIVAASTLLIAVLAIGLAGYLTLGGSPLAVAILRWLYRWPLFIPFIVAGQLARAFLAKNGLMNNALTTLGLYDPAVAPSLLDWRGIVLTFAWKQTPFVTLLLAGALASLDRSVVDAARNLGAGRVRILVEIMLPQVAPTLMVALVLSFVTMMSVLSVPMMVNAQSPTMLTVDMAFRINAYGDYGTANALGVISYLITGAAAWLYLRHGLRENRR